MQREGGEAQGQTTDRTQPERGQNPATAPRDSESCRALKRGSTEKTPTKQPTAVSTPQRGGGEPPAVELGQVMSEREKKTQNGMQLNSEMRVLENPICRGGMMKQASPCAYKTHHVHWYHDFMQCAERREGGRKRGSRKGRNRKEDQDQTL